MKIDNVFIKQLEFQTSLTVNQRDDKYVCMDIINMFN